MSNKVAIPITGSVFALLEGDARMSIADQIMSVLRSEITEERTDELLNYLFDKIPTPWYLKPLLPIAMKIVDSMLPERLLDGIEMILQRRDAD